MINKMAVIPLPLNWGAPRPSNWSPRPPDKSNYFNKNIFFFNIFFVFYIHTYNLGMAAKTRLQ